MSDKNHKIPQKNSALQGLFIRQKAASHLDKILNGLPFEPLGVQDIEDSRDRALTNKLVTTALRRHGHLNHILKELLNRGMPKRSGPFEAILRIGLAQLLFLPEMGDHSAIHLAVESAKRDKLAGRFDKVLNGVLRQAQRDAKKWRALDKKLLFPNWLAKNWEAEFGHVALNKFADALLNGAPLDLTLKNGNAELIAALRATPTLHDSVRLYERDKPVAKLPGYDAGDWWVQDVAATLPANLFNLNHSSTVLDVCAAPGGKTAQLVKAGYTVTAIDNSASRLKIMSENFKRLDYSVNSIEADATTFTPNEKFDGVLVDAPCTAIGTFRRHPEVIWHRDKKDGEGRVSLQRKIVSNAVTCLKKDGILVLCVCSLLKEENETLANWITGNFPQLSPMPIKEEEIGGLKGAIRPEGWIKTHPALNIPNGVNGTLDGFFIARWRLH